METLYNTFIIDNYLGLLRSLSRENKIKLAAGLINDIAEESDKKTDVINRFFGAFQSDKSAEEMIAEIRESRNFNRTIEAF
jgi:transposase-like protein